MKLIFTNDFVIIRTQLLNAVNSNELTSSVFSRGLSAFHILEYDEFLDAGAVYSAEINGPLCAEIN